MVEKIVRRHRKIILHFCLNFFPFYSYEKIVLLYVRRRVQSYFYSGDVFFSISIRFVCFNLDYLRIFLLNFLFIYYMLYIVNSCCVIIVWSYIIIIILLFSLRLLFSSHLFLLFLFYFLTVPSFLFTPIYLFVHFIKKIRLRIHF